MSRFAILLIICLICPYAKAAKVREGDIIKNKPKSKWGTWAGMEDCPEGTWVNGIQMKFLPKKTQEEKDDSATNGFRLFCSSKVQAQNKKDSIVSGVGNRGEWLEPWFCSDGFMNGFNLKALKAGKDSTEDEVAVTNIRVRCGKTDIHDATWSEGWNAEWTDPDYVACKEGKVFCGLETQLHVKKCEDEPPSDDAGKTNKRKCDETAINNIKIKCCPLT